MKIKDLTLEETPLWKLSEKGVGSLSTGELIAVIIGSGSRGESAVELAQRLLSLSRGKLSVLSEMSLQDLKGLKGIGERKAAAVMASVELGKRFLQESSWKGRTPLTSPKAVYDLMLPRIKGKIHEECWAVFLNAGQLLLCVEQMNVGAIDSTSIDIRKIIKRALDLGSVYIVLVHNHPGGNPMPSRCDIKSTEQLHKAASAFEIKLIDHIIISDDLYYSFADETQYKA